MGDQQTDKIILTGAESLAWGAIEAGVQFVTGHPGSPGSYLMDELLLLNPPTMRLEWGINERSAFDAAFAASLAGVRTLVCFKSVGLNVALDSLMVDNLSGGNGGFVVLTGDDPGGWGSQNEEDSRPVIAAAEVPMLEPCTPAEAREILKAAYALSERIRTPVVVRVTQGLAKDSQIVRSPLSFPQNLPAAHFQREEDRYTVTPNFVVAYHQRLVDTLKTVQVEFETSGFNAIEDYGKLGIIAPGYAYKKVVDILAQGDHQPVRLLKLGTLHPLPEKFIARCLEGLEAVLVVEEGIPYMESQIPAIAQRAGLTLPIYGRLTGHIPGAGELFPEQISQAFYRFVPGWSAPEFATPPRHMISQDPLCEGCPYIPGFSVLLDLMEEHGGRDNFIVTGESGCMIRAQVTPQRILDTKYAMGSSIGMAAGFARTEVPQKVVALTGDTAFLHTGIGELIDAVQAGVDLLVVLLDNATAAISGGQPHAAVRRDLRGQPRKPVDLEALIRATGVEDISVVDPANIEATRKAYEDGLSTPRISVVIIRHPCPIFASETLAAPEAL